jgi:hypothetical protein
MFNPQHAFIIGAMKSGTTQLHRLLAQHPNVAAAEPKEPEFFTVSQWMSNRTRGWEWYRSCFPANAMTTHWLDGSTGMTKAPYSTGDVARLPEPSKLIYLVRDPVARLRSHLRHKLAKQEITEAQALAPGYARYYLGISNYYRQLLPYDGFWQRGDLLILDFADLCRAPLATTERAAAFLGLPAFPYQPLPPSNVNTDHHQFDFDGAQQRELFNLIEEDLAAFAVKYRFDVAAWTK